MYPTDVEVRAQLSRILASTNFEAGKRSRKFLSYVVEETLAGRSARIKALSIAVEVLGRGDDFDAQNDPIVRMEARRLRLTLERYYLLSGQTEPVLIEIPKGAYVPVFQYRSGPSGDVVSEELASSPSEASVAQPESPVFGFYRGAKVWLLSQLQVGTTSRLVAPFLAVGLVLLPSVFVWRVLNPEWVAAETNLDKAKELSEVPTVMVIPLSDMGVEQSKLLAWGLTEAVITRLSRFKELAVMGRETSWRTATQDGVEAAVPKFNPDYIIDGSVLAYGPRTRITVRLLKARTGSVLWSEFYDVDLQHSDPLSIQENVADAVSATIAQPYGIVYRFERRRAVSSRPGASAGYKCLLEFYAYRSVLSQRLHQESRRCLEELTRVSTEHATAWAMLAYLYLDEYRFRYNPTEGGTAALERATSSARRAVQLEPDNARAQQVLMTALFFRHETEAALAIGERAVQHNPNDTELLAEYGTRLAAGRDWKEGEKFIKKALALNPGHSGYYYAMLALTAAMQEDYERAYRQISQADLNAFPLFHAIAAGIYGRLGKKEQAKEALANLLRLRPDFDKNVVKEMSMRGIRKIDQAEMASNLRKAGMTLPPEAAALADLWDGGVLRK